VSEDELVSEDEPVSDDEPVSEDEPVSPTSSSPSVVMSMTQPAMPSNVSGSQVSAEIRMNEL